MTICYFFLHLNNVRSVRANVNFRWPGEFVVSKGASRDEESRLITEYQAKWREESIGWLSLKGRSPPTHYKYQTRTSPGATGRSR